MRGQKMAVRSTQCQNRAVRSTQGGRGVSPSFMYNGLTTNQSLTNFHSILAKLIFLSITTFYSGFCMSVCLYKIEHNYVQQI